MCGLPIVGSLMALKQAGKPLSQVAGKCSWIMEFLHDVMGKLQDVYGKKSCLGNDET